MRRWRGDQATERRRGAAAGLLVVILALPGSALLGASPAERLARAQELIDAGETGPALELLDRLLRKEPAYADAYLLRSTVRFVVGEIEAGRLDLERALELDPGLRQAWLNRAALDLAEKKLDRALEALLKARDLDPEAADNGLNLGAVLALQGELEQASAQFQSYLARQPTSAEAYYLVASNYALAGYAALAVQHLMRAVELDEKTRLRARTDPNFSALESNDRFQELLNSDPYRLPPGGLSSRRQFDAPYESGRGILLDAVMNALQLSGQPFDRRVEVTPAWALIWSELRIKVGSDSEDRGWVEISAPAGGFSPAEWQQRSEEFFRQVAVQIHTLRLRGRPRQQP